ncbi:putative holin-like toxin [Lederbergia galactosidilytica]|nr:putative holin-like toxin [Lederbergia galactosidilytica]MBP1917412.1 hypothetical protein [Lederbergia galactosidilytica]
MSVFEAMILMISFSTMIVAIIALFLDAHKPPSS